MPIKDFLHTTLDYNKDGQINVDDVYCVIFDLMEKMSKLKQLSGSDKKQRVMQEAMELFGAELWDRFEPLVGSFIDFVYSLAQSPKALKALKKKCKCIC
jgi:hypothetical protein